MKWSVDEYLRITHAATNAWRREPRETTVAVAAGLKADDSPNCKWNKL